MAGDACGKNRKPAYFVDSKFERYRWHAVTWLNKGVTPWTMTMATATVGYIAYSTGLPSHVTE